VTLFEDTHTFTVAELGRLISEVLRVTFPTEVWVQGEVRSIRRPSSGHVYFDLVDPSSEPGRPPDGQISVVLFKGTREVVNNEIRRSGGGMRIDDGIEVRVRAVPDFYPPHGRLQLRMTGIDPAYTLGQLGAARDRLLRVLADEDLLDANRAIAFPVLALRVGLVTAADSAAAADFLGELGRSGYAFDVVFARTPVQGVGAASRIAAAITACARHGVDVIAVVRGGGARTDLVAFDDEAVARAIATAPVPVVVGVGHEIDTSVADLVAHVAVKTPTACAALLVERAAVAERRAEDAWLALTTRAQSCAGAHEHRLEIAARAIGALVRSQLREADHRTVAAASRARELTERRLERGRHLLTRHAQTTALLSRHRLDSAATRIDQVGVRVRLLDPARTLARGWSITTGPSGAVVRDVHDLAVGATITTRVASGSIVSTVEAATSDDTIDDPSVEGSTP